MQMHEGVADHVIPFPATSWNLPTLAAAAAGRVAPRRRAVFVMRDVPGAGSGRARAPGCGGTAGGAGGNQDAVRSTVVSARSAKLSCMPLSQRVSWTISPERTASR